MMLRKRHNKLRLEAEFGLACGGSHVSRSNEEAMVEALLEEPETSSKSVRPPLPKQGMAENEKARVSLFQPAMAVHF